jgi:hypothetical protein
MKGTPDAPRCGFSRKVVDALQSDSIPFASFDILQVIRPPPVPGPPRGVGPTCRMELHACTALRLGGGGTAHVQQEGTSG